MRKNLVIIAAILMFLPVIGRAADRCVVLELFCRTECVHCPGAAIGVDQTAEDHADDILVIEYHVADPFQNDESVIRAMFYLGSEITIPCAIFDGAIKYLGPDAASNYETAFQTRKAKDSPLTIDITDEGQSYLNSGTITATIVNESETVVTGIVHFTVTESNINYSWVKDKDDVNYCLRAMLEDAEGAEINLSAGADTTISRGYVISPSWPYFTNDWHNIEFGCFVQDTVVYSGRLKEIFQGAFVPMSESVTEEFCRSSFEVLNSVGRAITLVSSDRNECRDIEVFDASGRRVDVLRAGQYGGKVSWGEGFNPGIYFIKPIGLETSPAKVVLLR